MSKGNRASLRKAEKARKERQKARKLSALAGNVPLPEHIECVHWNSDEWKSLVEGEDGEYWTKAKGIALALVPEGPELRQPAFEDVSPKEFIDKILSLNTDPDMMRIEQKFAQKFGSYKALPYKDWAQKVHDLWMDVEWNPDVVTLEWAKEEVVKEIQQALLATTESDKIDPLDAHEALQKVTKGRNSGWPYMTSKWSQDEEMVQYYLDQAKKLLQGVDTLRGKPHILFKRVQPGGYKLNGDEIEFTPKMRPVECPPKHDAIAAKCFTDKFVEVFKTMQPYYGFNGGESVYKCLEPFMEYNLLVESDFSGFDQRCQHIMKHVFDVIAQLVPRRYHIYLRIVLDYYQHSELVTPIGILKGVNGRINGLNSGDGWTSVIGTLANSIAVKYTMKRMGVDDYLRLSFGDDIALATNQFDTDLFESYMKELGMDCNRSKQNVSAGKDAYFSFLGYYHFRESWKAGNQGKFPMCRIAPGLYYKEFHMTPGSISAEIDITPEELENLRNTPEAIEMVAIAAKLNNCRNNDDFESLVRYVREHSPHKLSTNYIMPLAKVKEAIRNGRKSRNMGLANSPVVQLLYKIEAEEGLHVDIDATGSEVETSEPVAALQHEGNTIDDWFANF